MDESAGEIRERVTGIEPAWPAWKAGALPLSYTRETCISCRWRYGLRGCRACSSPRGALIAAASIASRSRSARWCLGPITGKAWPSRVHELRCGGPRLPCGRARGGGSAAHVLELSPGPQAAASATGSRTFEMTLLHQIGAEGKPTSTKVTGRCSTGDGACR